MKTLFAILILILLLPLSGFCQLGGGGTGTGTGLEKHDEGEIGDTVYLEPASGGGNNTCGFDANLTMRGYNITGAGTIGLTGNLFGGANLYINYGGPESDGYLYFYDGSSSTSKYLQWAESEGHFAYNDDVYTSGYLWASWGLISNANIYANYVGAGTTGNIYFYENGSTQGARIRYDTVANEFSFNQTFNLADLILYAGGARDGVYDSSDVPADGDVLTWNESDSTIDWQPDAGATAGENNTLASAATVVGDSLNAGKDGVDLLIKDIIAGDSLNAVATDSTLTLNVSGFSNYLPLAGGTMSGVLNVDNNNLDSVHTITATDTLFSIVGSDTMFVMSNQLNLGGDLGGGVNNLTGVATIQYQAAGGDFINGSASLNEAEFEILDGATVTTAELNILDGVTATEAEIDLLDADVDPTLGDIADGTIAENLVNTANPWADNEVADDITIDFADSAGTVTNDVITEAKIADEAIQGEHLLATNSPTDNYFWSYDAGTGGGTWESGTANLSYFTEADDTDTSVFTATSPNTRIGFDDTVTMMGNSIVGADEISTEGDSSGTIKLEGSDGNGSVSFTVANAIATSVEYVLPSTDGSSSNQLTTDGAGNLSWGVAGSADEETTEDFVGGMVTGNTETGIAVTYEDGDGTLDFVVSVADAQVANDITIDNATMADSAQNIDTTSATALALVEKISDVIGDHLTGNTETGITVTHQDADNTVDFTVTATGLAEFGTMTGDDDNILVADGTDFESVAMSGDATMNNGVVNVEGGYSDTALALAAASGDATKMWVDAGDTLRMVDEDEAGTNDTLKIFHRGDFNSVGVWSVLGDEGWNLIDDSTMYWQVPGTADDVEFRMANDTAIFRSSAGHMRLGDATTIITDSGHVEDDLSVGDDLWVAGKLEVAGAGTGGLTDYDAEIGDTDGSPTYGIARIGNSIVGRTSYDAGDVDARGAMIIRNVGGPVDTAFWEYIFVDGSSDIRFGLPKSGAGFGTYNPRSMIIAGPWDDNDSACVGAYWGFSKVDMATSTTGADLGVQDDLEVMGKVYLDTIDNITEAPIEILADIVTNGDIVCGDSLHVIDDAYITDSLHVQDDLGVTDDGWFGGDVTVTGTVSTDSLNATEFTDGSIDLPDLAAGVYARDIVTTAPVTGATDNVLVGADADVTIALDMTAAWDFNGGSLELPNGANPTTDAEGEIAMDTDDESIEIFLGDESESALISGYYHMVVPLALPDSIQASIPDLIVCKFNAFRYPCGVEIDLISIQLDADAAYSLVVEEWSSADPPVYENVVTTIATGASDTYAEEAPDTDGNLDADNRLVFDLPTTDVPFLGVEIFFHITECN